MAVKLEVYLKFLHNSTSKTSSKVIYSAPSFFRVRVFSF